jgi:hypothetical protein
MLVQVGVAMFSTGNFKNLVGCSSVEINPGEMEYEGKVRKP